MYHLHCNLLVLALDRSRTDAKPIDEFPCYEQRCDRRKELMSAFYAPKEQPTVCGQLSPPSKHSLCQLGSCKHGFRLIQGRRPTVVCIFVFRPTQRCGNQSIAYIPQSSLGARATAVTASGSLIVTSGDHFSPLPVFRIAHTLICIWVRTVLMNDD